jgi:hypothetical protein
MKIKSIPFAVAMLLLTISFASAATQTPAAVMAKDGNAQMPITISAEASDEIKALATTLAQKLGKISGVTFQVATNTSPKGIALGTITEFPSVKSTLSATDVSQAEDYIIRTHAGGVYLIGATDKGVANAAWDFLYRLGYRRFFPGKNWEVFPSQPNLSLTLDVNEHPDFLTRSVYSNYGQYGLNRAEWAEWDEANRIGGSVKINTGHAWGGIIRANKEEFAKHPEYFALINGERKINGKFCIAEPGLRKLVADYALDYFKVRPEQQTVSIEPSDGGGWDESPAGKAIGTPSDQMVVLANEVIDAVREKYPTKKVAFYAYNAHSPAPSLKLHPGVVVNVATAFIKGGFTFDELAKGWNDQGAEIGVREYYSIFMWNKGLPGRIGSFPRKIKDQYENGVRYMIAESGDDWGPMGLHYYLASRALWDVDAVNNVDALITDFLDKSFGDAAKPMRQFYGVLIGIDGKSKYPFGEDFIGRLYRSLDKAEKATTDPGALSRIGDLALYVRYLEMYQAYFGEKDKVARQQKFEDVVKFAYRIYPTHMVHSQALYREKFRDGGVTIPEGAGFRVPEKKNPWKSSEQYTHPEILKFISYGVAANEVVDFTPISFSDDLVPATPLKLTSGTRGYFGYFRGNQDFYTWVKKAPVNIALQVKSGHIYSTLGGSTFSSFPVTKSQEETDDLPQPDSEKTVPPDRKEHETQLEAKTTGLNRIRLSDQSTGTVFTWDESIPMTIESSLNRSPAFFGGTYYFYVPKGTKIVGGFSTGQNSGTASFLQNADGENLLRFKRPSGYFQVPVVAGQDGRLWKITSARGKRLLMTVPPYIACTAQELLLPREVVEADALAATKDSSAQKIR